MSTWEITQKPAFLSDFIELNKNLQKAVKKALKELTQNPVTPRGNTIKKLQGYENVWRYRLGDFRLIYATDRDSRMLRLLAVGPRSSVYERFNYRGWDAPGAAVEFGPRMKQAPEWTKHPEWFKSDDREPQKERLPRKLAPALLNKWEIPKEYHPVFMRCLYAEDLMNVVYKGVPEDVLARVMDGLYPPSVEQIAAQPDKVLLDPQDLLAYAEGTLTAFLLRLDETQKPLTNWALSGPTLVKGGPGSGKSTVALYRIRAIVEHALETTGQIPSILFTTYTNALINFSASLLRQLLRDPLGLGPGDPLPEQIRITTMFQVEREIVRHSRGGVKLASKNGQFEALQTARGQLQLPDLNARQQRRIKAVLSDLRDEYLLEEFDWVIEGQNCTSRADYLEAERVGRAIPFHESLRAAVWELYEHYRDELLSQNSYTYSRMAQAAFQAVADGDVRRQWDYVIVDEAQDLPPVALALCVELCRDPSGLFLTADANQSLYNNGFRWTYVHRDMNVQGRTRILRRNYRSTQEIAGAAAQIMRAGDDFDADAVEQEVVHSGAYPVVYGAEDEEDQARWIAHHIYEAAKELRLPPNAAAVLVSRIEDGQQLAQRLNDENLPAVFMRSRDFELEEPHVKVTTLHAAKGLEFPVVVIARAEEGCLPWEPTATDPQEISEFMRSQRRLFYVGCTRAMRYLFVTYNQDAPSPFLHDLSDDRWMWIGEQPAKALDEAWTTADVTDEAIGSLAVGQQVWLTDAEARTALNKTLHAMGFITNHGDGYTDWTNGETVFRVLHKAQGHDEYSLALRREED